MILSPIPKIRVILKNIRSGVEQLLTLSLSNVAVGGTSSKAGKDSRRLLRQHTSVLGEVVLVLGVSVGGVSALADACDTVEVFGVVGEEVFVRGVFGVCGDDVGGCVESLGELPVLVEEFLGALDIARVPGCCSGIGYSCRCLTFGGFDAPELKRLGCSGCRGYVCGVFGVEEIDDVVPVS